MVREKEKQKDLEQVSVIVYKKTCVKQPLKNIQNRDINDKW